MIKRQKAVRNQIKIPYNQVEDQWLLSISRNFNCDNMVGLYCYV